MPNRFLEQYRIFTFTLSSANVKSCHTQYSCTNTSCRCTLRFESEGRSKVRVVSYFWGPNTHSPCVGFPPNFAGRCVCRSLLIRSSGCSSVISSGKQNYVESNSQDRFTRERKSPNIKSLEVASMTGSC